MGISALIQLGLALCSSASILPRTEDDPGFLSYPIVHRQTHRKLTGRDVGVTLHNQSIITYLFELDIGTPPQRVEVVLDTGSFELWVDPTCSAASTDDQAASCQAAGLYDFSSSSTAVDMDAVNQLPYGKGIVNIAYVADNIKLPGSGSSKSLKEVIFGVGLESQDLAYGIAGVGHGNGYNLEYDNLVDVLYEQGVTKSRAFSVALGNKDGSNGGTIVFGGVDTMKFSGNLVQLENLPPQMEQGQSGMVRFWIQLDSVGITQPGGKSTTFPNSGLPVVLDTGASLSYLPESIVSQFATELDATFESDGTLSVDCSKASQAGTVDFKFGTQTIRVPFREFLLDFGGTCVVGVMQVDATTPILGDTFLRSAYVVFDIDGGAIYLAQHQDCGTNEKALPVGNGAAGKFEGECKGSANAAPRAASGGVWGVFTMAAVALGIQSLFVLVL